MPRGPSLALQGAEASRRAFVEMTSQQAREAVDRVYRNESRRILATLIRLLGDFDRAEEAIQEAFATALDQWPNTGVPDNPRAWLVSTGRFKAIDSMRRQARFNSSLGKIAERLEREAQEDAAEQEEHLSHDFPDDTLRLIFTCCHPALSLEARVALTLREVCGLTTDEIARAFLTPIPTIAQRIVRAKAKIRDAGIPYRVPTREDLPDRLDGVLQVVYLVFSEGYSASSGELITREELSEEAIRLGRLLYSLAPEAEVAGLLALMLLQESRRAERVSPDGDLVLLQDQDRALWDKQLIAEGQSLVQTALVSGQAGSYSIQAAIAAVHSEASHAADTDWRQIAQLYAVLVRLNPSPVIELNRSVAVAMSEGPTVGVALVDALLARGELTDYHLVYSTHAELCRRAGRTDEARSSYTRALELARQEPERRFLRQRLVTLDEK